MKVFFAVLVSMCLYASKAFPTTFEECYSLGIAPRNDTSHIHLKIDEYEAKLKADPADYYSDLALGILYYALAAPVNSHEEGSVQKLIDYTDKFLAREPDNPLALVYNGVGHGITARDAPDSNMTLKITEVNKAVKFCNEAVDLAKGKDYEWKIRYMRATFYIVLPDFFKERDTAMNDYRFIEAEYNKNTNDQNRKSVMGEIRYYLGEVKPDGLPSGVTAYYSYNYASFNIENRYDVFNNEWNAGAASARPYEYIFEGTNGSSYFGWLWSWQNTNNLTVLAYPEVFCGKKFPFKNDNQPGDFPFPAGERKVESTFDITEIILPYGQNTFDLAYDLWVVSNSSLPRIIPFQEVKCEIMIWLDSTNCYPGDPIISNIAGSLEADGRTFDFYCASNWGGLDHKWIYAAFNTRSPILKSARFDITPFLSYLVDKKVIDSNDLVCTVELGTEVSAGSGMTVISNYSVNVVDK